MRTKKTAIVLISGLAGSGKTTVKDILYKLMVDASLMPHSYSFALPLKYVAKAYFGWDGEKDEKGRKLLQSIGYVGRQYDENLWCKHLLNYLKKQGSVLPPDFIVVDDWRFKNEKEFFGRNPLFDVVCIRVYGRGGLDGELGQDASETELPEALDSELATIWYDFTIDNSTSIEELTSKVEDVASAIKTKYVVD